MNYVIEAFDKNTEALVFEITVPDEKIESLKIIMGWSTIEDSYYGYDLDSLQLSKLEALLGRSIFEPEYDFQLGFYS